jgi:hypothetical protein
MGWRFVGAGLAFAGLTIVACSSRTVVEQRVTAVVPDLPGPEEDTVYPASSPPVVVAPPPCGCWMDAGVLGETGLESGTLGGDADATESGTANSDASLNADAYFDSGSPEAADASPIVAACPCGP